MKNKTIVPSLSFEQAAANYLLKKSIIAKRETACVVDCEIDTDPEIADALQSIDASLAEVEPIQHNPRKYIRKLRMLSGIHSEIASQVNSLRQATYEMFFREEDKYIPAGHDNLVALMVENAASNRHATLP